MNKKNQQQKFWDSTYIMHINCLAMEGFSGGSRIFSRGGGGRIFKKFSKISSTFFLSRLNWNYELSQSTKKTLFLYSFPHGKFLKQTGKKSVF